MNYTELEQIYSGKNNESLITAFFSWWFSVLPQKIIFITNSYTKKLLRFFSLSILIKTIFSPWKRDIINTRGMSLQEKFQVWIMNIISRLIGFVIRSVTILIGLISILIAYIIGILFLLIMLLIPLFIILVIVLSLS